MPCYSSFFFVPQNLTCIGSVRQVMKKDEETHDWPVEELWWYFGSWCSENANPTTAVKLTFFERMRGIYHPTRYAHHLTFCSLWFRTNSSGTKKQSLFVPQKARYLNTTPFLMNTSHMIFIQEWLSLPISSWILTWSLGKSFLLCLFESKYIDRTCWYEWIGPRDKSITSKTSKIVSLWQWAHLPMTAVAKGTWSLSTVGRKSSTLWRRFLSLNSTATYKHLS